MSALSLILSCDLKKVQNHAQLSTWPKRRVFQKFVMGEHNENLRVYSNLRTKKKANLHSCSFTSLDNGYSLASVYLVRGNTVPIQVAN